MRTVQDVDRDGYYKPIRIDDWGYQAYFYKLVESDFGTRGVKEQDPETRLQKGQRIHVKWPDGTITLETIVALPYTTTVNDMGNPYNVSSETLHIAVKTRGLKTLVPLEDCRIKVARKQAKR